MGDKTGINWADASWNPLWTGEVRAAPDKLDQPIRWKRPRRIFVNSMSDLFHESVSNQDIAAIFGVMAAAPQHTFLTLTKRAKRMREWFEWYDAEVVRLNAESDPMWPAEHYAIERLGEENVPERFWGDYSEWPLPNVHVGVSVEDQDAADERIPHLIETPAAVRWLSVEPMLGPIRFGDVPGFNRGGSAGTDILRRFWVVVGGESGPGARECHIEWIRAVIDQCRVPGVPVWIKQLGARPRADPAAHQNFDHVLSMRHRSGEDWAEWPEDLRVRELPR